jgi:hypothetical protein
MLRAHHNDGNFPPHFMLAQSGYEFETIHFGHHQIEQY